MEDEYLEGDDNSSDVRALSPVSLSAYITQHGLRDIQSAVSTVTSAKHGNGVSHALHWRDLSTFWQSDGTLPHKLKITLSSLTAISAVAIYLHRGLDESYTPRVIAVVAGTHESDGAEVAKVSCSSAHDQPGPCGWILLELGKNSQEDDAESDGDVDEEADGLGKGVARHCVWCVWLEIALMENYENGRDCHVRGVRVLAPGAPMGYSNVVYSQHNLLR